MNGQNQAIKQEYAITDVPCYWPQRSKWRATSHNILYDNMDYPDLCDQIVTYSNVKKERYPQLKVKWRHVYQTGSDFKK